MVVYPVITGAQSLSCGILILKLLLLPNIHLYAIALWYTNLISFWTIQQMRASRISFSIITLGEHHQILQLL